MNKLIFALVFLVGLSGCSLLEVVAEDQNQLALQYATLKVLERDDVSKERVLELVGKAKTYVNDGDSITVTALVSEARKKLYASSLSPADQMLIEAILARAQERIEARLGDGVLDPDHRVQLMTVLSWIESAANGYVTGS